MELKKKIFTTAPLPFMGQKRRFLNEFRKALKQFPEDAVYVDLFGGSGLLSHTVKALYPESSVVYNDYDNYRERIENISKTNQLIADLRIILIGHHDNKKIDGDFRDRVLERILKDDKAGYVDYLTLSSSILFSMKSVLSYEALVKETMYNTVKQSDYNADGYLDGLEIICACYKEVFTKYKDLPNVVFLFDPPYLSTDVSTYKNYWKLKDYLDVLQVLVGTNFFYFTSNKSSIIELCEWIETKTAFNPFKDCTRAETSNPVNFSSSYTDIMMYKYS